MQIAETDFTDSGIYQRCGFCQETSGFRLRFFAYIFLYDILLKIGKYRIIKRKNMNIGKIGLQKIVSFGTLLSVPEVIDRSNSNRCRRDYDGICTPDQRETGMLCETMTDKSFMNREEYRDKVLGCWTGKNIGGTLGAPMEGKREMFDVSFYTQDLRGEPAPNDDLDLQLVWLRAIEKNGIDGIDEKILGEYWLAHITGPWNEYGVCKFNMINGFLPPLSGLCNNGQWKNSNGAWIRAEIWASLFPGEPDEVVSLAWNDACVDHAEDGIYAEIFIAALESAAFIEKDIRRLVGIALARIPENCRVARSVRLALHAFDAGSDWRSARDEIVRESSDLGWFQAPANVAFAVIGLLYGAGNFGRSVCIAVNCGDDTDCTGATCGAILGIIGGRSGIPPEWVEPIGESIRTVAVNPFRLLLPTTLDELTDRVIACRMRNENRKNVRRLQLTDGETAIAPVLHEELRKPAEAALNVLSRSSTRMSYALSYGRFSVEFEHIPVMHPGETQKLTLIFDNCLFDCRALSVSWDLPEGWSIQPGPRQMMMIRNFNQFPMEVELTAGRFSDVMIYLPVELHISDRKYPCIVTIPIQQKGAVRNEYPTEIQPVWSEV